MDAPNDILFMNEYLYENDLLTNFARLQAQSGQRKAMVVVGVAFVLVGFAIVASGHLFGWAGMLLAAVGLFCLWYQQGLHHRLARHYIDAIEQDTGSFGNRFRRIAVSSDGAMVFARDGRSRYFPFEKLERVLADDLMFVLIFGEEGLVVPRASFIQGTAEDFETFLSSRSS